MSDTHDDDEAGHYTRLQRASDESAMQRRAVTNTSQKGQAEIERLRARVAELEAAQELRSIETALKDGSRMLLALCDGGHVYWCVTGVWSDRFKNWNDGMEPAGLADPTHWMPLPSPPKVTP